MNLLLYIGLGQHGVISSVNVGDNKQSTKLELLRSFNTVTLTRDHWTPASDQTYLRRIYSVMWSASGFCTGTCSPYMFRYLALDQTVSGNLIPWLCWRYSTVIILLSQRTLSNCLPRLTDRLPPRISDRGSYCCLWQHHGQRCYLPFTLKLTSEVWGSLSSQNVSDQHIKSLPRSLFLLFRKHWQTQAFCLTCMFMYLFPPGSTVVIPFSPASINPPLTVFNWSKMLQHDC